MSTDYIDLSYWQVALAAGLIVINAAISLSLRLGLERRLVIASLRMAVQLLLVGLILHWVFALSHWYAVAALAGVMTVIAGIAAVRRTTHRFPGVWTTAIIAIWASAWLVTVFALTMVVSPQPWYHPQYAIPLIGLILGNTLNGVSLGIERFSSELENNREQVETLLALGATRWEAALSSIRQAVRTGMIPILNAMVVAGIVNLPGIMTGQLLSGVAPIEAVKYQIVIMFLIAAGAAMGTVISVLLSYRWLFNDRHQFLYRLIRVQETEFH